MQTTAGSTAWNMFATDVIDAATAFSSLPDPSLAHGKEELYRWQISVRALEKYGDAFYCLA
jgi:hypothetical protein